jgi:hypothetical protein
LIQFDCPSCGWLGHPSFDLNKNGKLMAKCQGRGCDYVDPSRGPKDFNHGLAVPKGNPRGSMSAAQVVNTSQPHVLVASITDPVISVPVRATHIAPSASVVSTEPVDVIGQIKARRDWLEAEIARLEGYRLEKKKLDRMMAAARRVEAQHEAAMLAFSPTEKAPN